MCNMCACVCTHTWGLTLAQYLSQLFPPYIYVTHMSNAKGPEKFCNDKVYNCVSPSIFHMCLVTVYFLKISVVIQAMGVS